MITRSSLRSWLILCAAVLQPLAGRELFAPAQMARIREGLGDIYNLDHTRAVENFERMIRESPDEPAGYAYLAMTLWRRELSDKQELSIDRFAASDFFSDRPRPLSGVDASVEERFRKLSQAAAAAAKQRLARAPDDRGSLFILELTYQNLASFEASLKRNWWAAFRYGARSYAYNRELLRRDPNFHDARLATGVCAYVAGSLGWSVRWLALLMGYRGSRTRGIAELEAAAAKGQLAADDARVMLVLIYTREHNYAPAYAYLAQLLEKYPRNYLFHLDMAGIAMLMNETDRAIAIYEQVLRKNESGEPNYQQLERAAIYNRLGAAFRAKGRLPEAASWVRRALAEPGVSARSATMAHLELGKALGRMGRCKEAILEYQSAAAAPDFAGTRQEAQKWINEAACGAGREKQ